MKATLVTAAATVLLLAGCSASPTPSTSSDGSGQSESAASGDSAGPAIAVQNFAFKGPTSVAAGATVSVTNLDSQDHSVTSDDGSFFDVVVHANGKATFKAPTTPGSYAYHCSFHPNMRATLVVK